MAGGHQQLLDRDPLGGQEKKFFADFVLNISIMVALAELRDATKRDLEAVKADLAAVRSELGAVRWAIGLLAALVFAIGLRLFGSIR